jgi:hypothetical protein
MSCQLWTSDFTGFEPETFLGKSKFEIERELSPLPIKNDVFYKKGNKKHWYWKAEITVTEQKIEVSKYTDDFGEYTFQPYHVTLTFDDKEICDTVKISISTLYQSKDRNDLAEKYYMEKTGIKEFEKTISEDLTPKPPEIKQYSTDYVPDMRAQAPPRDLSKWKHTTVYQNGTRHLAFIKTTSTDIRDKYEYFQIAFY